MSCSYSMDLHGTSLLDGLLLVLGFSALAKGHIIVRAAAVSDQATTEARWKLCNSPRN